MHTIVSLSSKREKLVEYSRFKNLKFEIQIRSILQHAWAEIEHDIGYKSALGIPKEIRRKFSRIAGLLETADENFCEVKQSINEYNNKITESKNELLNTDLNLNSLTIFTNEYSIVNELDKFICNINDNDWLEEEIDDESLSRNLERLSYFGVSTISDLNNLLIEKKEILKKFSKIFLSNNIDVDEEGIIEENAGGAYPIGISYLYLAYILLAESSSVEYQTRYIAIFIYDRDTDDDSIKELLNHVNTIYKKII